jgi:hypothetical protein
MFGLLESNGITLSRIQNYYVLNKLTKTILVTLVLFHCVEFKYIKVFDTKMNGIVANRPDGGRKTSDRRRAFFAGLHVILYLRAGTDSAQPIRVVRDSCIKG